MQSKKGTRTYTANELLAMREAGQDQTDLARLDRETEAADDEGAFDWMAAVPGISSKEQLTLRLDAEIVAWFKAQGKGYQTRMNAVLRSYVTAHRGDKTMTGR